MNFSIPPSYTILESKNRLHRISIFVPDFVQICP
nr:MAG TPA: Histone acetyltransferase KAT7 [Bacteriophage sp.]